MLAPWQIFWQELVGIGGDGEMRGRIERRPDRQHRRNDYDRPRIARAEADHLQDRRCQHALYSLGNTGERAGIFSTPLTAKSLQSLGQSRGDNQNFQATATTASLKNGGLPEEAAATDAALLLRRDGAAILLHPTICSRSVVGR